MPNFLKFIFDFRLTNTKVFYIWLYIWRNG